MLTKNFVPWVVLLLVCASALLSCGDDAVKPKPNPLDAYSSIEIIRDYQFVDNFYFSLTRRDSVLSPADLQTGDSITTFQLYYSIIGTDYTGGTNGVVCKLVVDPTDTLKYPNEVVQGQFKLYQDYRQGATYTLYRNQFFIIMDLPVPAGVALGAYIEYRHPNGDGTFSIVKVGDVTTTPGRYLLKTIQTQYPQPIYVTWNNAFRNVYSFAELEVNPEKLVVKIFKGYATSTVDMDDSDLDHTADGRSYINLFGLDHDNNGSIDTYDDKIIDWARHLITFPNVTPFADSTFLPDSLQVKAIYNDNNMTNRQQDSKYYIFVGVLK